MPIDTRIPLSIEPLKIPDPAERENRRLRLEQIRAQAEERRATWETRQRAIKEDADLRALFNGQQPPTPEQIMAVVGPERGAAIMKGLGALQTNPAEAYQKRAEIIRDSLVGMSALSPQLRAEMYSQVRQSLLQSRVIGPNDAPEQYSEGWFTTAANYGKEPAKPAAPQGLMNLGNGTVFDPNTRTDVRVGTSADEKKPTLGSFEDYVSRYAQSKGVSPEALTPAQIEDARKRYQQSDDRPRITVNAGGSADDANAIADAIIRGDQPPELTGLYGKGAAVRAALAKKGYNQAAALTDWRATQKHVNTLNGAQQTRMGQAIDNAAHSLDVIDNLATQWKGGKFPALNKAQLAIAKAGGMGPQAQKIAVQLEAQISDVTSELANVYMGGNSPTDHALTLAAKNLSADWSQGTLVAMTTLARRNLQIRANSMRNVGVAGASANNPYDNQPAAAPTANRIYYDSKGNPLPAKR